MSGICQICLRCGYDDEQIGQHCDSCKDGIIERAPEFHELVDTLPEPMTCGRRMMDQYYGGIPVHRDRESGQDRWQKFKRIDNRVCSFCGSLHPDDFFRLVKESAEAPDDAEWRDAVNIETTDKNYKIYVNQPGVRNAHEGGIKFYTQHLPRKADGGIDVTPEQQNSFQQAVRRSGARHDRFLTQLEFARFNPTQKPN